MEQNSTTGDADGTGLFAGEAWFDPIEAGIRDRVRGFIQELLEQELTAALGRKRCERAAGEPKGYRNGSRERQLLGSFGPVDLEVPRARMAAAGGGTEEWRSASLGTMRKCGVFTPPLPDRRWPGCRWPVPDATARTRAGACHPRCGCVFAAAGARPAGSTASAGAWRSAC